MAELDDLLKMVVSAKGPNSDLDLALHKRFPPPWLPKRGRNRRENVPQYTASIDAALSMVSAVMPGWTWRLASCSVSDDAWVCPDFNDPKHGQGFQEMFNDAYDGRDPAEVIMEATDVARHPPGLPALTLIEAMLRGLIFHELTLRGADPKLGKMRQKSYVPPANIGFLAGSKGPLPPR